MYLRNVNGEADKDGLIRNFFPVARGVKTATHTMELVIDRDFTLKSVSLFDDIADPYQIHNISPESEPELFEDLCSKLGDLLKESDDIWYKNDILNKIKIL